MLRLKRHSFSYRMVARCVYIRVKSTLYSIYYVLDIIAPDLFARKTAYPGV